MAAKNFSGQACLIVASLLTDKHDYILRRNIVKTHAGVYRHTIIRFQYASFRNAKGGILGYKRPCFAMQNMAFYNTLTINELEQIHFPCPRRY